MTEKATRKLQSATPDVAAPISLDTHHVRNWDGDSISAILHPQASDHAKLAWCYGQVKEMNDLLWGYINLPPDLPGTAVHEMADAMLNFIEHRMTPLLGLLEVMCEESSQLKSSRTHTI